ncbi:MAG: hypothetical protein RL563_157 [Pseudomonadota bacterium]
MQLAISVLGKKTDEFLVDFLSAVSMCHCSIIEFNTCNHTRLTSAYLLIDGNWNHIAKLENLLEGLRQRYQLQISLLRPDDGETESDTELPPGVPYMLETISSDKRDILYAITQFMTDRGVMIEEITASRHGAAIFEQRIFTTRFLVLVPDKIRIMSLREEFLDFCDGLNIDAIFEPIKR